LKSRSPQPQPTMAPPNRRPSNKMADQHPALKPVAELFARFRRDHPRGARVPRELRSAAIAALKAGVAPGDLYRSCRISWSQVAAWKGSEPAAAVPTSAPKRRHRKKPARREAPRHSLSDAVRVFTVADDPGRVAVGPELELRLGTWSVSVRLAETK
jgi:hypothetical protein